MSGKNQRVSLSYDDFEKLVAGKEIVCDGVHIILQDIGFDVMKHAIRKAVPPLMPSQPKSVYRFCKTCSLVLHAAEGGFTCANNHFLPREQVEKV